ncbi:MAG: hypothetical protein K2W95_30165 [Candidatus Obscuribacterales bacterium]|nr:hypothetical protein [Candidatus Obscuribacterales bacterium]
MRITFHPRSEFVRLRKTSGSSLVTVMGIGLVSTLWISAMMGMVMPSYQKAAQGRTDIALRASAEAALDWAVSQLNVVGNTLDDSSANGTPGPLVTVPTSVLGQYSMSTTATVRVNNVPPPDTSALYDPALDPSNAASNGGITQNGWRVVTATAQSGKLTRSVRIILRPSYSALPIFDYSLFGRTGITMYNSPKTDSYDSSIGTYATTRLSAGGNVGTNTRANLYGVTEIGGDLNVMSSPPGSTNVVVRGNAGTRIKGRLTANGTIRSTTSGVDYTSSNVEGLLVDGSFVNPAISTQQTTSQKQLPPAPPAPTGAVDLGTVRISDWKTITLQAPGDYVANKLQISSGAKIVINGTGPVRIFVRGATASVGIAGNGIVNNGRPQDLQIFYNGGATTSISGSAPFTGVLYAPNSQVRIVGSGHMYGAIAAGSIYVSGTNQFHYDRSLASMNNNIILSLSRMQTVSWEEI